MIVPRASTTDRNYVIVLKLAPTAILMTFDRAASV